MKKDVRHIGLRTDAELHGKLLYAAEYEGRSMNELVLAMIRAYVREFERMHGPIELPKGARREDGK